jgi:hypothetical protein
MLMKAAAWIAAVAVLAFAIPLIAIVARAIGNRMPNRPIKGMALVVPVLLLLLAVQRTGLMETIGLDLGIALRAVAACGAGLVLLDGFSGRSARKL